MTGELNRMASSLEAYDVSLLGMESTSVYWRRVHDLNHEIVTKLNRLDAALQRCNIRISNYVSSLDGKAYGDIVDLISEGKTSPEELIKKVHGRTLNKHGREVISMYKGELDLARKHKDSCLKKMAEICTTHFKEYPLPS